MDQEREKEIRDGVRKEFRLGRARLFRVEAENKLRAEIADDKAQIFAAFKELGLQRELALTQKLARLLMNFSKLASYRGVVEGYHLFQAGLKLSEDRARYHLVVHLQDHPDATNRELVEYLDGKNHRLSVLKINKSDPLWALLPRSWEEELKNRGIDCRAGAWWDTALEHLPDLVMPYLSRAKKMAKQPRVKNALFSWKRIIREHEQRRKNSDKGKSNTNS